MEVEGDRPEVNIDCILFATDFSSFSENAGRYAHLLARYYAAKLIVTHVLHAGEAEELSRSLSREREHISSRLSRTAHALSTGGVDARPILLEGNTETMIATLAEQHAPTLIVLGTHDAGGKERQVVGSTAERIVRSTHWPCLLVGPHLAMATASAVPFQHILYASDFTPAAANAAIYAISLAKEAGAAFDVLNVIPDSAVEHPDQLSKLQKHVLHELDQLVPAHAREACNPRTFVYTGDARDRVHEHIEQHNIDLLVIGVRKSSHLDQKIRTSHAFRLMAEVPCPVLTIRS